MVNGGYAAYVRTQLAFIADLKAQVCEFLEHFLPIAGFDGKLLAVLIPVDTGALMACATFMS